MAHGFQGEGESRRRAFRCGRCRRTFVPGATPRRATEAVRAAVRRVRRETGVNYRLLASALTAHLGVPASHATVGAWCRAPDGPEPEGTPCEYLSLLWALRQVIEGDLAAPRTTREAGRAP